MHFKMFNNQKLCEQYEIKMRLTK